MADRKIHCLVCNCYLGVIRDAKLKIGINHICAECVSKIEIKKRNDIFEEVFSDIFGDLMYKEKKGY